MIASLKGYGRIAKTVLTVLAGLLIIGIAGSLWMGGRARHNAEAAVIDQATQISNNSLALAFAPSDLTGAVSSERAVELSDKIRAIVLDPSEFTDVTLLSPSGTILYSTKLSLIGSDLPGERDPIREALKGIPQTTDVDGVYSVMVPLKFRSGVGDPAAIVLERPDSAIVSAPAPWRTNAMFMFALLVLLGVAVFGVARVLAVVATTDDRPAPRPQPIPQAAPIRPAAPHPGLREEGDARRRAEDRARAAEERLTLLQEQYRKALDDLQSFQRSSRDAVRGADPRLEERALRAEGQVAALQQQIQTLAAEREHLYGQVQDLNRLESSDDPLAAARARHAEEEAEHLRTRLQVADRELEDTTRDLATTKRELDRLRTEGDSNGVSSAEAEATHRELMRTKDALQMAATQIQDVRRELDDTHAEMRALRNEEARAAMLDDELRSTKAEIESLRASHRADLVEREADLEEKVRAMREDFQDQVASIEQTYKGQIGQRESELAARVTQAEADARSATRELAKVRKGMEAARAEAEGREQRLIQAAGEMTELKKRLGQMEQEVKERTVAIAQTHKEADDLRRSVVGLQADLQRADDAVTTIRAELEQTRASAHEVEGTVSAVTRERAALTERVDKLARMLEAAAAENADLNRRLQDSDARRKLELADDEGRSQLDDLLRVTQERLAGQTEKLIAVEDLSRELETALQETRNRAEIAEGELRTHQMAEALREMRTESVDAAAARELPGVANDIPFDDRRGTTPFMKELSVEAKKSLSRINGITQLLKHQKGAKEQAQLLKQLATYAKRLDATVADISEADNLAFGTIELQPRRTDLEALVIRVVEESEIGTDHEVRVMAEPISLAVDPYRTEQTLSGLLRSSGERTPNSKPIIVRLQSTEGGALLSVEDTEPASDASLSPVVRRFAELQGGWAKVESRDGGGSAFRVFLPDANGSVPRPAPVADEAPAETPDAPQNGDGRFPIVVEDPAGPTEPTPEQILSRELRRLAEAESNAEPAHTSRRRRR